MWEWCLPHCFFCVTFSVTFAAKYYRLGFVVGVLFKCGVRDRYRTCFVLALSRIATVWFQIPTHRQASNDDSCRVECCLLYVARYGLAEFHPFVNGDGPFGECLLLAGCHYCSSCWDYVVGIFSRDSKGLLLY